MTTTSTTGDPLVVPVPAGADVAVRVRGLAKAYGETKACDGVSLDVVRGEVLALLGPNGAGKTTTTEILEGYRHRDAGEVSVLGHDPSKADPLWRSRLGIVLQTAADLGDLTVEESVDALRRLLPEAPRRRRGHRVGRPHREAQDPRQQPLRRAAPTPRRRTRHHRPP